MKQAITKSKDWLGAKENNHNRSRVAQNKNKTKHDKPKRKTNLQKDWLGL
jgi:3-methyladenine DNA glycosylase AlkC